MDGIFIFVLIIVALIIIAYLNTMNKYGKKVDRVGYKKTIGRAVNCIALEDSYKVVVEFVVDGNIYRAVDENFPALIDLGVNMEVFYDESDPRVNKVGELFDIYNSRIICPSCKMPLDEGTVICPNCRTTLDYEKFMENPAEYIDPDDCMKLYTQDALGVDNPLKYIEIIIFFVVLLFFIVISYIFFTNGI